MNLADAGYCDFVVWTSQGIHIERITKDKQYFEDMLMKLKTLSEHRGNGTLNKYLSQK